MIQLRMMPEVDVLVVGGGAAGLAAAVSAARNGVRVRLIERYGFLGGTATAALVGPWMAFHGNDGNPVVRGIGEEVVDRLMALGGSPGHLTDTMGETSTVTPFDPETYKFVALEMIEEARVDLLLHTMVTEVVMEGSAIRGVLVHTKNGPELHVAPIIVDASGDADVAFLAGAPYHHGRDEDGLTQPVTLMFRMANVRLGEVEAYMRAHPEDFHHRTLFDQLGRLPLTSVSGFFSLWQQALEQKLVDIPRERILLFRSHRPDVVTVNTTRVLAIDGTDSHALTRAEVEARKQAFKLARWMKETLPGFQDSYLMDTAAQVGVRETRRIVGDYTLSEQDLAEGKTFPDTVARGGYPVDLHHVDGSGFTQASVPAYSIPFRILVPQGVDGLMVAGRSISATREALSSLRITSHCFATGQAAGVAAALCAEAGVGPRDLDIEALRGRLRAQGALLD